MYVTIYGRYISINDYGLVYTNISLKKKVQQFFLCKILVA